MYKVDLHTHSIASPDGSLTLEHYRQALGEQRLDYVAITDHNRIDYAQQVQAVLGERIIVGEEITAKEGEVIGLFLTRPVPAGLPLAQTIEQIISQGGLVYIPHPFESVRKGLPAAALDAVADQVAIVEVHNGRAVFQNKTNQAEAWARAHAKAGAASSDAHGWYGWCKTYSTIDRAPMRDTLPIALAAARYTVGSAGVRGVLYPKFNRLRRKFHA